jgi:DNA-binding NarL/FixJ family response regulator
MGMEIRIILADDHPIVRQGLRQMIEIDRSLSIIAEAGDGAAALELIEKHLPEIAVLDIDMPRMDGFAVTRAIQQKGLAVAVIFLTMHSEDELFQAAIDLGVKGYVLKDSAITDIVASIKSVAAGKPYLSPSLSANLLSRRRRSTDLDKNQPGLQDLSPTERRVLKLIAEDKTSKDIAAELFVSPRTVETHRSNICKKLDLHGTLALVKFAVAHKSEL